MLRIGHGFDIHRFTKGPLLILGGVHIPFEQGMAAHSDGDVLIHALCDALLGAAALGDIGQHFPDHDGRFKSQDSRIFLRAIVELLEKNHYAINNVDTTIMAQTPKLAPFINQMRDYLAADLGIDKSRVSVKATTMEELDAVGASKGIAVHAVALIMGSV